jgi:hypothetical protein
MNKKIITILFLILIIVFGIIAFFSTTIGDELEINILNFVIELETWLLTIISTGTIFLLIIGIIAINFKGKKREKKSENKNEEKNKKETIPINEKNNNDKKDSVTEEVSEKPEQKINEKDNPNKVNQKKGFFGKLSKDKKEDLLKNEQNNKDKNNIKNDKNKNNIEDNKEINGINKTELVEKRNIILQELKNAESQFLKNKINKENFDNFSKEKNSMLISIEAEIDSSKKNLLGREEIKQLEEISEDKKKILKGLLEQKQKKIHELRIAEKSYYKRKIDQNSFGKISNDIKNEIISIDTNINSIQKNSEIEKIKIELKKGAKEISKQQANSDKRKSENEIFEEEVFEQIDRMVGGLER